MLAFDPLLRVLAIHVLPRQLEQYLVVFGLQALAAGALQRAHPSLLAPPVRAVFEAATTQNILSSEVRPPSRLLAARGRHRWGREALDLGQLRELATGLNGSDARRRRRSRLHEKISVHTARHSGLPGGEEVEHSEAPFFVCLVGRGPGYEPREYRQTLPPCD
jgi:hypothetical protein